MHKETITYEDFDGLERTEEFRFSITKSELFTMQNEHVGGLAEYLQTILDAKDTDKMLKFFNWILLESYGEKTPDGRAFMKSDEIKQRFKCSIAYDIIYNKMLKDPDYAMKFLEEALPKIEQNQQVKNIPPMKK